MASRRSKNHGVTPGTVRGQDKNWLSEGMDQRRFNYAWEIASKAVGQTTKCKKCGGDAKCFNAAVTIGYGAVSFLVCSTCGREFTREISPDKMADYYQEDLKAKLSQGKDQEATT